MKGVFLRVFLTMVNNNVYFYVWIKGNVNDRVWIRTFFHFYHTNMTHMYTSREVCPRKGRVYRETCQISRGGEMIIIKTTLQLKFKIIN